MNLILSFLQNVCPSAGQQQSVGIASTDHHPIMDCLDSRMSGIFTRVHVPVQEALMFVAPSGSVPSSEFMHVLCEKIILHKVCMYVCMHVLNLVGLGSILLRLGELAYV